jgi:hypothetical protein
MDAWMDAWMDGCMDGWMHGWMDGYCNGVFLLRKVDVANTDNMRAIVNLIGVTEWRGTVWVMMVRLVWRKHYTKIQLWNISSTFRNNMQCVIN